MKPLRIVLFGLFAFFLLANIQVTAQTNPQENLVNVDVTTYFDEGNTVTSNFTSQVYGSRLAFDGEIGGDSNYVFSFWIVNGVVRFDYTIDQSFVLTEDLDIVAVFKPVNKIVAAFVDTNGKVFSIQYLNQGDSALSPTLDPTPSKPGYTINLVDTWGKSLSNLQADIVFTLQYTLLEESSFQIDVTNGSGDGLYAYNTVATITADIPSEGMFFQYWKEGTKVVSYSSTYSFTVLSARALEAVYSDTSMTSLPIVSLSAELGIRDGYLSYLAQYELPSGYSLIEHGMVTSTVTSDFITLSSSSVTKNQSNTENEVTHEYLLSFSNKSITSVRAYIIVEDPNGNFMTIYNEVKTDATVSTSATDLFFSFYMEGSSYNKAISIFNGTGQTVDLSEYTIRLFANGAALASPSSSQVLSGTLADGEVFVIANSGANATIQSYANMTSSTINHNGDDAFTLEHNGTIIDCIGQVGTDPGTAWSANGVSTLDMSLSRLSSTTSGDNVTSDAYDPSLYWTAAAIDTVDGINTFTMSGGSSSKSPVSFEAYIQTVSYSAGGSLSLANSYLLVYFDDGSSSIETITSDMVTNFSTSFAGDYQLTVTYNSLTDILNYDVTGTIPDTTAPLITISGSADFNYLVGETWDHSTALGWCSASDDVDGSISCTLEDASVNTAVAGSYTITYSATDSSSNTATQEETVVVSDSLTLEDLDYSGYSNYYVSITTSTDVVTDMADLLRSTISYVTYGDARYVYVTYANGSQVVLYDVPSSDTYQLISADGLDGWGDGGVIYIGDVKVTLNREHVWACSDMRIMPSNGDRTLDTYVGFVLNEGSAWDYRPGNDDSGHYSDLINLWNALASPNSTHSDHFFGEELGDSVGYYLENGIFYPGEEYKGDIARILFYMTLMYPYLTLVDQGDSNAVEGTIYYGFLDILLQWNEEDPVSAYELERYETIFGQQGNRNPFVDFYDQNFAQILFGYGDPEVVD